MESTRRHFRLGERPARLFVVVATAATTLLVGCSTSLPRTAPSAAGASSGPRVGGPRTPTTVPAPAATSTPTTTPASPGTSTAPAQTAPVVLAPGSTGPAVLVLQQRLSALGYWLGSPDGTFGASTQQAVYALQKAAGISRDGIVGPVTQQALAAGTLPRPRSDSGDVVEVDLEDDLLMFVTNGKLEYVLNVSTGGGYTYTSEGVTAVAKTPVGHFQIYRQVDAMVVDSLGELWRPKFFDDGFAIHGDSYVPPYPVSHGCVRVSNEAIDWIWADDLLPIGTAVWVY